MTYPVKSVADAVLAYVRAIRNPAKRAYAEALAKHLLLGGPYPPHPDNLSVMVGQSVRMRLDRIFPAGPEGE